MKKTLSKTITSILLCLSLVFSSIGFLPMSAFAGSNNAGVQAAPINVTSIDIRLIDKKTEEIKDCPTKINVGESFTLKATFNTDAYANYKKVAWSVTGNDAEGNAMSVGASGCDIELETTDTTATVTVNKPGTVTITATAKNGSENLEDWKTATVTINVLQPVTDIEIEDVPAGNTMDVDRTYTLSAKLSPSNVSDTYKTVEWKVTSVDINPEDIKLTNITDTSATISVSQPGKVTITATAKNGLGDDKSDEWIKTSVEITVIQFTLNKSVLALSTDATGVHEETLTATVLPEGADQIVTWESDNAAVAEVDSEGKVTAKALGQATITAKTTNGLSATCKVYVDVLVLKYSYFPDTGLTAYYGSKEYSYGPVKLSISGLYWSCPYSYASWLAFDNTQYEVTSNDNSFKIKQCRFHYETSYADVNKERFAHAGFYIGKIENYNLYAIDQIDVYFTRNANS